MIQAIGLRIRPTALCFGYFSVQMQHVEERIECIVEKIAQLERMMKPVADHFELGGIPSAT